MPVARLFWHLVLPGSVSRVAFALYIVFDGMFVGHCMGHDALAAITMMWPLIAIFFAVSDMISTGSSVQISVYLGKKDSLRKQDLHHLPGPDNRHFDALQHNGLFPSVPVP